MSESLTRAFPARLAAVVTGIEQSLPVAAFGPTGSVTVSNSRAWPGLVVAGEPVVIPMRVYNPEPSPRFAAGRSPLEAAVTAAVYSRHHDGYVRHRQLGTLLDADERWAAPFIVQLLGEYVIQIHRDIERFARTALPARPPSRESLLAFSQENPCFVALTRQRAISYWSCYYRGLHALQGTYPALAALSMLGGSATT